MSHHPQTRTISSTHASATPIQALHLWHLLSLDAPTVATLWTWFVARTIHLHLPTVALIAMFLAVWMLYAADRLLDATTSIDLEARHRFHRRHSAPFITGVIFTSIALAILLPHLKPEAIHLYLILGGLLAGYFILIHVTPSLTDATHTIHRFPKEIAVGIFFAAATFIPTVAHRPELRLTLLPPALLFAAVCCLNCLFIYAWEHDNTPHTYNSVHLITRFALQHLTILTLCIPAIAAAITIFPPQEHKQWPLCLACALSATLLLLLHHRRHSFDPTTLRASADLALLTPLLILALPQ